MPAPEQPVGDDLLRFGQAVGAARLAGYRILGLDPTPTPIEVRQEAFTLARSVRTSPTYTGCRNVSRSTAASTFPEVEVPADHLLGEENHGFRLAMMTLDGTRPGVAALATGIARAAMEFPIGYSRERIQFGVPIAMHEAIQFMIADMATGVEAARLLTWQAAVLLDQGRRNTLASCTEATVSSRSTRLRS